MKLNSDMKLALEAARLFLAKTDKIDIDGEDFWPATRMSILGMRDEANEIINCIEDLQD